LQKFILGKRPDLPIDESAVLFDLTSKIKVFCIEYNIKFISLFLKHALQKNKNSINKSQRNNYCAINNSSEDSIDKDI